jgi:MFS family permease
MTTSPSTSARLAVLVAALGYFVDIYDLLLFGIVRQASLRDLGVPEGELLSTGVWLLDAQMAGLLLGGFLWGVVGDRRGRLSVLFASIFLYSAANVANGLVTGVPQYAVLRFVAGVGLAGELGAGITLVSELVSPAQRGMATTVVAAVGICGAVVAALVGDLTTWRTAYFVGGGLGLALLLLRVGVVESGMFRGLAGHDVPRGDLRALLWPPARLRRYLAVVLVAVPVWYVVGILVTFSPELGLALGLPERPVAGRAIMACYAGLAVGDLASGLVSQWLRSRKRAVGAFLVVTALGIGAYFAFGGRSLAAFYACCFGLGCGAGYWAVFMTTAAEQFGTNVRATATTTAPNLVRGFVMPLTWAFTALKPSLGAGGSAVAVGVVTMLVAAAALRSLEETFGRDLDFVERAGGGAGGRADT